MGWGGEVDGRGGGGQMEMKSERESERKKEHFPFGLALWGKLGEWKKKFFFLNC